MSLQDAAGERPGVSLTVREAAAWLSLSEDTVRRMMRTGRIDWFATGERYGYRIPASEIERLLAAQSEGKTLDNPWIAQARRLKDAAVVEHLEGLRDALRRAVHHADALERITDEDDGEGAGR